MTHRLRLRASRNMGLSATVSARALKLAGNCFRGFFHHHGTSPPRIADWMEAALLVLEIEPMRAAMLGRASIAGRVDDREWLPTSPSSWRSRTQCRRGIDLISG